MQRHNYCIIIPIRINQTLLAPFSSRTPLQQISFPDQTSPNLLNFKTIAKTDSEGSPRGLSSFFNLLPVYPLLSAGPLRNAASSPWKGRSTGGEYRQRAIVIRHATRPYKDRPPLPACSARRRQRKTQGEKIGAQKLLMEFLKNRRRKVT